MRVTIDGQEYVPASALSELSEDTAKAILRAMVSCYYAEIKCGTDGGSPKALCDCSRCHLHRVVIQFLGAPPACHEELNPAFRRLWEATE